MDKRVAEAMADAPEVVKPPDLEELSKEVYEAIEEYIIVLKLAGDWPRRIASDDAKARQADKKPVRRLAHAMNQRYRAWAKATEFPLRFTHTNAGVLALEADVTDEERVKAGTVVVAEYVEEFRRSLWRQLGIAAVGRYRIGDREFGSVVWRLLKDIEVLDVAVARWKEDVAEIMK